MISVGVFAVLQLILAAELCDNSPANRCLPDPLPTKKSDVPIEF